jgi:hypothetical protein
MNKIILLIVGLLILTGCESIYVPPSPIVSPINQGKVALLVDVKSNPTHTHIGTTVFNNFSKQYPYEWQLGEKIYTLLESDIEKKSNLKVVNLKDLGMKVPTENLWDFVVIKDKQWFANEKLNSIRKQLKQQNIIAIVKIVEKPLPVAFECTGGGCVDRYSEGYGLYTRSLLGFTRYEAAPSFDIAIELLDPVVDIEKFDSISKVSSSLGLPIKGFKKPNDFKNISELEFEPVKRAILENMQNLSQLLTDFFNGNFKE